jgi:hypothetical protein
MAMFMFMFMFMNGMFVRRREHQFAAILRRISTSARVSLLLQVAMLIWVKKREQKLIK